MYSLEVPRRGTPNEHIQFMFYGVWTKVIVHLSPNNHII